MFDWKEQYELGIQVVDQQHKEIFHIARDLHAAMAQGKGKDLLSSTLDRLIRYTAKHFAAEEQLMRDAGYPELSAHIAEHRELTQKVLEFQRDYIEGRRALTLNLLAFIKDWLNDHIQGNDRKYAPAVSRLALSRK